MDATEESCTGKPKCDAVDPWRRLFVWWWRSLQRLCIGRAARRRRLHHKLPARIPRVAGLSGGPGRQVDDRKLGPAGPAVGLALGAARGVTFRRQPGLGDALWAICRRHVRDPPPGEPGEPRALPPRHRRERRCQGRLQPRLCPHQDARRRPAPRLRRELRHVDAPLVPLQSDCRGAPCRPGQRLHPVVLPRLHPRQPRRRWRHAPGRHACRAPARHRGRRPAAHRRQHE